jgi:hypothetical protein
MVVRYQFLVQALRLGRFSPKRQIWLAGLTVRPGRVSVRVN